MAPSFHEDDIIVRCNNGDESAWHEFYYKYSGKIRVSVRRYCKSTSIQEEDAVQEVFIRLLRALKDYDHARSIDIYIMEIARRVAISELRKETAKKRGGELKHHKNQNVPDTEDEIWKKWGKNHNPEDLLLLHEQTSNLRSAINLLTTQCRSILQKRFELELSYREIAIEMKVEEGALRVRVQRCLSSLRDIFFAADSCEVANQ
jgi:RNA polymerase sigma-70 factor, ECF subfamily